MERAGDVVLGQYRLQERVGEGAFSEVWRAADEEHGRLVAIKILKPLTDPRLVGRLEREGRLLAQLDHPNVVRIFGSGGIDGRRALVLEFVEGETLRGWIGRLSAQVGGEDRMSRIAAVFAQICAGVASAHEAGVVHRDLKPENVLVWQDRKGRLGAKVLDFGLGRLGAAGASSVAMTVGTYEYMSPEQALSVEGESATAASDVFSLGVMLVELVTGSPLPVENSRVTWERLTDKGQHVAHLSRLRAQHTDVSDRVWAVVGGCIAPVGERFADGDALLEAWLVASGLGAVPLVAAAVRGRGTEAPRATDPGTHEAGGSGTTSGGVETTSGGAGAGAAEPPGSVAAFESLRRPVSVGAEVPAVPGGGAPAEKPVVSSEAGSAAHGTAGVGSERVLGPARREGRRGWVLAAALVGIAGVGAVAVKLGSGRAGMAGARGRVMAWAAGVAVTVSERGQDAQGRWEVVQLNGVPMRQRWIAPGTFTMGSPETEEERFGNEGPQHVVVLTRGFWLGETEVTQAQWRAVMGNNPSQFPGDDRPVEQVSWEDVQGFLQRVNRGGASFRLPTEAEWEYAARAGSTGARHGWLDEVAWYEGNSGGQTHSVGQKAANAWGLRDMLGNVWEWCADRAVRWEDGYAANLVVDPQGPSTGSLRVRRGGSWGYVALSARAAFRGAGAPSLRGRSLGFRLARGQ